VVKRPPSRKTLLVLQFIVMRLDVLGYPPTMRELMSEFGWHSTSVARHHLERLNMYGLIKLEPGRARGITVDGEWKPSQRILEVLEREGLWPWNVSPRNDGEEEKEKWPETRENVSG